MTRHPIRRRVQPAPRRRRLLGVLQRRVRRHGHFVARSRPASVAVGAEPDALARGRPVADHREDLLARDRDLDRLLQLARRHHREDRLGVNAELGSEAAADERTEEMNLLRVDAERARDRRARLGDDLRAQIHRQVVAVPHRQAAVRLHRLRELVWRRVALIDLDGAAANAASKSPTSVSVFNPALTFFGRVRRILWRREVEVPRLGHVLDVHELRGSARLLERVGDDERDRLAEVLHVGRAQHRKRARVDRRDLRIGHALRRRVLVRQHQTHAGRVARARACRSWRCGPCRSSRRR